VQTGQPADLYGIPGARRYRNERNHAAREEVGKVLCPMDAHDAHVDQTFLNEVPFPSDAREVFRRCVVNKAKFSSKTRKGFLCPEKSIRSTRGSTAQ
jgi:hypothetical protein